MMFVPLNLAAYAFIPKEQTNNASGLFSLVRNEGSSIGVALSNTLLQRRTQFHQSRMIEHIIPLARSRRNGCRACTRAFRGHTSDPVRRSEGHGADVPDRPAAGLGGVVSRPVLAVRHAIVCSHPAGVLDEASEVRRGQHGGPLIQWIRREQQPVSSFAGRINPALFVGILHLIVLRSSSPRGPGRESRRMPGISRSWRTASSRPAAKRPRPRG